MPTAKQVKAEREKETLHTVALIDAIATLVRTVSPLVVGKQNDPRIDAALQDLAENTDIVRVFMSCEANKKRLADGLK